LEVLLTLAQNLRLGPNHDTAKHAGSRRAKNATQNRGRFVSTATATPLNEEKREKGKAGKRTRRPKNGERKGAKRGKEEDNGEKVELNAQHFCALLGYV